MHEHARRDNELATFTNQLLAGEEPETMKEIGDLATVVRQIQGVIAPEEKTSPQFRAQLGQRLEVEWRLQYRQPARWWGSRRARRVMALAASLLMLVAAAMWFSWQHEEGGSSLKGTAFGPTAGALVVFGVALGGLGLIAFFLRKR